MRVTASPELTAICLKKKAELQEEWRPQAVLALRDIIDALRDQAAKAIALKEYSPEATRTLAGAGKILGELLTVESMFPSGQQPRNHRQNPPAPTPPSVGARAAGGAGAPAGEPATPTDPGGAVH
jgi:hypothetical protein